MNHDYFKRQLQRLQSQPGWERSFGHERSDAIWNWARNMPDEVFKDVVTAAISECDRAPLLPKLKEIWSEAKKNHSKKFATSVCCYCGGSGFYVDPASPLPGTAYACRCALGATMQVEVTKDFYKPIPAWTGAMQKVAPTQAEINWRDQPVVKKIINEIQKELK